MEASTRSLVQGGYDLWSKDTPFGSNGYFIADGWDYIADTSFHVLTTDGILGRDKMGN